MTRSSYGIVDILGSTVNSGINRTVAFRVDLSFHSNENHCLTIFSFANSPYQHGYQEASVMGSGPSVFQSYQPVTEMAVKSIYNWAGCAIGGYALPPAGVALEALSPLLPQKPGNCSILGSDVLVDVQTAALVNGIASHVDDYDDTHADTPVHPSGPVASALLAMAELKDPVSGRDFITAFVAGVEAECKLGLAVYPEHYDIGWRK